MGLNLIRSFAKKKRSISNYKINFILIKQSNEKLKTKKKLNGLLYTSQSVSSIVKKQLKIK